MGKVLDTGYRYTVPEYRRYVAEYLLNRRSKEVSYSQIRTQYRRDSSTLSPDLFVTDQIVSVNPDPRTESINHWLIIKKITTLIDGLTLEFEKLLLRLMDSFICLLSVNTWLLHSYSTVGNYTGLEKVFLFC